MISVVVARAPFTSARTPSSYGVGLDETAVSDGDGGVRRGRVGRVQRGSRLRDELLTRTAFGLPPSLGPCRLLILVGCFLAFHCRLPVRLRPLALAEFLQPASRSARSSPAPSGRACAFRHLVATRLDAAGLSAREIADYLDQEHASMRRDVYMARKGTGANASAALDAFRPESTR